MIDAIRDYIDQICYGKSLEKQLEIREKALTASLECGNDEPELIKRILDISREYNS